MLIGSHGAQAAPEFVLFLDFDGVLHGLDARILAVRGGKVEIACSRPFEWARLLEPLLASRPDVAVAVHSSWRRYHSDAELREMLPKWLAERFVGCVPREMRRAEGIAAFAARLRAKRWLALDDQPEEFPAGSACLVECDPALGVCCPRVQARVAAWVRSLPPPSAARLGRGAP